jgi:hypothetical protein
LKTKNKKLRTMKSLFYFIALFISIGVFSQEKIIEVTNLKTGKINTYKEKQRLKIRTLDGKKHIGNLEISDNQTLIIDNQSIKIDSLFSIKSRSKKLGNLKTIGFALGLSLVGSSIVVASEGGNAAFLLFTLGTGITLTSVGLEGLKNNNTYRKSTYKIIEK